MTVVVDEGIIVVVEVMVHPLAIALSVAALVIGFVIALMLVEVVLGDSLLSSVVAAVVAEETVFLDQIGLVIVTWMIVMMVAVMGTVTLLTAETGMVGVVIVMPMIDTRLVVIALVQTGMEVRIVISQVVMVGSEKEAMREMELVAMAAMIGVAQGAVDMTGMVHVAAVPTTMAVEDLLVMMEEVTGRDLGRMTAPAEEDAMMIASNELFTESSYVFAV